MTSEPRPERREPTSPELVLVSPPDAARRAREELPPPVSFEAERAPPPAAPRQAPQPPPYQWVQTEPPEVEPPRPRRRRVRLLLAAWILGVAGATAWYVTTHRDEQRQARVAGGTPPSSPAATHPASTSGNATRPATTGATGTTVTQAPHVTKPAQKPKTAPPKTPTTAVAGFVPARAWTWSASPGARAYVFRMALNGREVLRIQTTRPRLVLPRSFRFHAGTYRWTVQRVPAPKNGRALVDSKFVVTAAAAKIANG